jgi:hypothetical protein
MHKLFRYFLARLAFYGFIEAMALHGTVVLVTSGGPGMFEEDGPIEWLHFGLLMATAAVFLRHSRQISNYPISLLLCSTLALIGSLRELDRYSERLLFEDAYKYVSAVVSGVALYYVARNRQRLGEDINAFIKQRSFLLLAFGAFLAVLLAQILGQSELWHALIDGPSGRNAKRVLEETLETVGYLMLFCGSIEVFYDRSENMPV